MRAYELTGTVGYLNAAKLTGATFLKTMQDEQTYVGFAQPVTIADAWLLLEYLEGTGEGPNQGLIGLISTTEPLEASLEPAVRAQR